MLDNQESPSKEPLIFDLYNKVKTAIYHQVEAQYHGKDNAETKRRVVESRVENIAKLAIDPIWLLVKDQAKQLITTQQSLDAHKGDDLSGKQLNELRRKLKRRDKEASISGKEGV